MEDPVLAFSSACALIILFLIHCIFSITYVISNTILFTLWIEAPRSFSFVIIVLFVVGLIHFRFGLLTGVVGYTTAHVTIFSTPQLSVIHQLESFGNIIVMLYEATEVFLNS